VFRLRWREPLARVIVGKWGKSLSIRLPGEIERAAGLRNGERLDIEIRGREIVIHRAVPRFTVEELLRGKSPEEWRSAYAGVFDWGLDIGREVVDE
jgi:antitoxin component of MazEF toxin-antitoxin module